MHTAMLRPALLPIVFFLAMACRPAGAPETAPVPEPAATRGTTDVEEAYYRDQADSLRRFILRHAEWVELGSDSCNPGTFRSFVPDSSDTTAVRRALEKLVRTVIVNGVEQPLEARVSQDLLKTVITWEADVSRPNWDVLEGQQPRRTMPPGLGGQFVNPATGACERYIPLDGLTFVIPNITGFTPPDFGPGQADVVMGDEGLGAARSRFFATHTEADPIFSYTRIAPVVVWYDYGVVTVNRPAEHRGVRPLPTGAGGATFLFHRVGAEWRLMAIVNSWA